MVKNDATHLGQILLESKLLFIPSSELRTKTLVECLVDALVGYNDDHPEDFPNKIRDSILTIHNLNFPEPSPDDPMKVFINRDIHIHKALLFNSLDKQVAEDLIGGLPSSMQSGLNIKHISDEASSPKS
jgi:hypothetical protein